MIQSYIFDLYGTLVDIRTDESMPSLWRRMATLYTFQGASYTPQELKKAYLAAVEEQIDHCAALRPHVIKDHIEPDILDVFAFLYAQKGVPASEERLRDTALFFRILSLRRLRLYPNAIQVLRELRARGKGIYLLSNAQSAFTMPELHRLGMVSLFDGIVLSSDVGVKKPDKAIFEHLLSKYGLCPVTCLMIGNDEAADMGGAASVGISGRYIHTKQSPERQNALPETCREIKSLSELL